MLVSFTSYDKVGSSNLDGIIQSTIPGHFQSESPERTAFTYVPDEEHLQDIRLK